MAAPIEVVKLVERFAEHHAMYTSPSYVEASLRQDFLDPFFRYLGWDVGNTRGLPEHLREVVVESRLSGEGTKKVPDYAFRIGGVNKFFAEAKKPAVVIERDPGPAHQLRTYGWNGGVAYSLLCDFQELSLYDTRIRPEVGDSARVARLSYMQYTEFIDQWDWIEARFGRESVAAGTLDRIANDEKVKRRTFPVDEAILAEIEQWRRELATEVHYNHPELSEFDLGFAVQLLLDRMLFLRISEDRGIEPTEALLDISNQNEVYPSLIESFRRADARYNSGLFHLSSEKGRPGDRDSLTPRLSVSNATLRRIIRRLYWPNSAYNFRMLSPHVLGNVYEQFLGSVIRITEGGVSIDEKPEVRKAGGVVYTPEMVVAHILDRTLGAALEGASVGAVVGTSKARAGNPLRVLDPACGSGSFLIAAYQRLLDWFLGEYLKTPEKWTRGRSPRLFRRRTGEYLLTTNERKRILLDHVYGVDIDHQAVEVTKLSLLLKVLENESAETVDRQMALLHERALPDLGKNIKCGNSLIDRRFYGLEPALIDDEVRARRINPFTWEDEFPAVFGGRDPGFDVVVGNPPYVLLQDAFRDDGTLAYLRANYRTAAYKIDLYHVFMEKSSALTRAGGLSSLITPSNWLTNNYLVDLRRFMLEELELQEITLLDKAVFARRSVDCAIYVARSSGSPASQFVINKYIPDIGRNRLVLTRTTTVTAAAVRQSPHLLFTGGAEPVAASALEVMRASRVTLGSVANVNFGKQLRNRKEFLDDVVEVGSGPRTDRLDGYARCYTGSDIERWCVSWSGLACLDDVVAQRGGTWDPRMQNAVNKILCRQVGLAPDFAIDQAGYQCLNTMFMINVDAVDVSPWFVLGVLNAAATRAFWLDRFWDRRRTFPKIKGTYLKELPLPARSDTRVEELARSLTQHAEELHATDRPARRLQLERVIAAEALALDDRVAELYGLAPAQRQALTAFVEHALSVD